MRELIERAILEHPHDPGPFGVYADWLIARGDPRGALINVQLALEDEKKTAAEREDLLGKEGELLSAHGDLWLGPLASLLRENPRVIPAENGYAEVPNYQWRWRRGFLHELSVERLYVPMARALRDFSEVHLLRKLSIGAVETEDHEYARGSDVPTWNGDQIQFVSAYPLARADLSGLVSFQIGADTDFDAYLEEEYGPDCHTYCKPLPDIVARMPRVESLRLLCKDYDMGALFDQHVTTRLRVLEIAHFGVYGRIYSSPEAIPYAYPLERLAKNPTFCNLTHLLLHPHREEWHWEHSGQTKKGSFLPLPAARAVLRSKHLSKLTHLQLRLSNMGDAGIREIIDSGALARLQSLDLRHGCVTDEGAALLAAHPDVRMLRWLDLSGNALSPEGVAVIEGLGSFARADHQMSAAEIAEEAYLYRGDSE